MEDYRLMDKILRDLNIKQKSTMDFEAEMQGRNDDLEDCFQELLVRNLIEMPYEDGGGTFVITGSGRRFISTSSFEQNALGEEANETLGKELEKQERERKDIEFNWKAKDENRKNLTVLFAVITLCFGAWNIFLQISNTKASKQTSVEIDSLKKIITFSSQRIDSLVATSKSKEILDSKAAKMVSEVSQKGIGKSK